MKVLKNKSKKSALLFNKEEGVRDSVKELLTSNVDGIFIVEASSVPECLLKLQNQKFTLLVMNSEYCHEENERFVDLVFKDEQSSPDNIILLGEPKKIDAIESVNLQSIPEPLDIDKFQKIVKDVFYPKENNSRLEENILKKVSAKLLTELAISTDETVETLSGLKLTKDEIYKRNENAVTGDVSGVVLIHSKIFKASVAVSFSMELFLEILGRFQGGVALDPTEEELQFAGEICNQVCGLLIEKLEDFPTDLKIDVPRVITNTQHVVDHPFDVPVIAIRYTTMLGDVVMETAIEGQI